MADLFITIIAIVASMGCLVLGWFAYHLKSRNHRLEIRLDAAAQKYQHAHTQFLLAQQREGNLKDLLAQLEAWKKDIVQAARADLMKDSHNLSSKLLDDYKREHAASREESNKKIHQVNQTMQEQFSQVVQKLSSIEDWRKVREVDIDGLKRSFEQPAGAGLLAETMLGNSLQHFGLTEGVDYLLQHSVVSDGQTLRPDAILRLPGDTVIVIDSKASRHYLSLSQAEVSNQTPEEIKRIELQIKERMRTHLRSLSSKAYGQAAEKSYQELSGMKPRTTLILMFLPSDAALERLSLIDAEIQLKAKELGIYIVGPAGLWAAAGIGSQKIELARRSENLEGIAEQTSELLERFSVFFQKITKLGNSVHQAQRTFDDLAKSANGRLLPSMRKLVKKGVREPQKGLPKPLPTHSPDLTIESVDEDKPEASVTSLSLNIETNQ